MSQSATKPMNGYATSPNSLIRDKVVFDGGNRTTAWINPSGKIEIVFSIIKFLEDWEDCTGDEKSILIEHESERYVLGEAAKMMLGRPIFEKDKTEMALQLLLPALQPNPGERVVTINEVLIALPDSRDRQALANLKKIEGTHEFMRNGQHVVASIRRVRAIDETKGAYVLAAKHGVFLRPDRINGVLDLGGGTSIARLYKPNGDIIRSVDCVLPGTAELARKIDAALLPQTGKSQNLSLIMDAIADGSLEIGTSGVNFANIFDPAVSQWIDDIRERIKGTWSEYLPQIAEVLIIGGAAPLAKPLETLTKGRFKIAPSPQVFNLKGMEVLS